MQSRNHQRRIDHAEHSTENDLKGSGNTCKYHCGHCRSDLPANRAQHKMGGHYRQKQAEKGDHDHGDDLRRDLPEKFLQVHQGKCRQDSRNHLPLIPDHVHLKAAEIPLRYLRRSRPRHRVGVKQLPRHQRQSKDNAQHLGGPHLLCDGPADAYRQHVEYRLTDEPQKAVNACPELADVTQSLRPVFKQIDAVNTVPKAKDQTACDDGRDQRREDLRQRGDHPLEHILVFLCRLLYRVL